MSTSRFVIEEEAKVFAFLSSRAAWRRVAFAALLGIGLAAAPADGSDVELVLDNDYGSSNQRDDDLYTFGLELRKAVGAHRLAFSERAFTDKRAGVRFDESALRFELHGDWRLLPGWRWRLEGGLLHVGRGAFGQDLQNRLHSVLANRQVELEYLPTSLHPLFGIEASRSFKVARGLLLGPHLSVSSAPGHKSTGLLSVYGRWWYRGDSAIDLLLGVRGSHASTDALEPHLAGAALAWELRVDLYRGIFVTWSHNRYGTSTGHLGIGYRFSTDRRRHQELSHELADR